VGFSSERDSEEGSALSKKLNDDTHVSLTVQTCEPEKDWSYLFYNCSSFGANIFNTDEQGHHDASESRIIDREWQ
jgi:hypothetical protein